MSGAASLALGLPLDASTEGWRIDGLLHFAHWATATLAFVVVGWLLIVLVRDRKHKQAYFTHGTSNKERAVPLVAAALVLGMVDAYLLVRSHRDLQESILAVDQVMAEREHIRVQIGARQWAWQLRYPGLDGRFDTEDDFYTLSNLVVPIGVAVVYELSSLDVVHSLYLPNFRVKQDAIPGRVGRGWFAARRSGRYEIACAQHCGVHHYQMAGSVEVLSPADFADWQASHSAEALRISKEASRAREQEAGSATVQHTWPELAPTRDWAWPWREGAL